jgi:hypothetical protein
MMMLVRVLKFLKVNAILFILRNHHATNAYLHTYPIFNVGNNMMDNKHEIVLFSKMYGESDEHTNSFMRLKFKVISRINTIGKQWKPVALAFFTSALLTRAPINIFDPSGIHPPAAHASAPLVPVKRFRPPNQKEETLKRMKAQQDEEKLKAAMAHRVQLEEIEAEFGAEARAEYEKKYEADKSRQAEEKALKRKELMYDMALKGICPFVDVEGIRQMYLFDRGIDLNQVPASPQNKEAKILSKYPNLAKQRAKQRFVVKCVVDDLILKGKDPLPFLQAHSDSTAKILNMQDPELDLLVEKYTQLIRSRGSISGVIADKPFNIKGQISGIAASAPVRMSDKQKQEEKKNKQKLEKEAARALQKQKKDKARMAETIAKETEKLRKEEEKRKKEELKKQELAMKQSLSKPEQEDEDEFVDEEDFEEDYDDEFEDGDDEEIVAESQQVSTPEKIASDNTRSDVSRVRKAPKVGIIPVATVVGIGSGAYMIKLVRERSSQAEEERQRQFQLIMGLNDKSTTNDIQKRVNMGGKDDDDDDDLILSTDTNQFTKEPISNEKKEVTSNVVPIPSPLPTEVPKKRIRIGGITSVFSKKASSNREIVLKNLISSDAPAPKFAMLLAKLLTFGAPGRFPSVSALPGGMPMEVFDLDKARDMLLNSRNDDDLTSGDAAELFASVVNCMIIDIIDLASSSLGVKEKKDKATVDALNVVLDFMDHAASLYDAVAEGVVIKPVVYGGALSKAKTEEMFSIYAASMLSDIDGKITQSRVDTLQLVFNINDKRAEGLIQKATMKNLMNMMKNGGEGMEGMEGLSSMLAGLANENGGVPGLGNDGDLKPEDLKQSISMMKELIESGSVSKEEIDLVRKQFKETYGK